MCKYLNCLNLLFPEGGYEPLKPPLYTPPTRGYIKYTLRVYVKRAKHIAGAL